MWGDDEIVSFGGDHHYTPDREGTLYFTNNTVITHRANRVYPSSGVFQQNRQERTVLFYVPSNLQKIDARNNVFFGAGDNPAPLAILNDYGTALWNNNWANSGIVVSIDTPAATLSSNSGNRSSTNPGFTSAVNLKPAANSPLIDGGIAPASFHPAVNREYALPGGQQRTVKGAATDIGAFEGDAPDFYNPVIVPANGETNDDAAPVETDDSASNEPGFSDTLGHWAETLIREAASFGIVKGYPNGEFRPDDSITRAELAVLLHQMLKSGWLSAGTGNASVQDAPDQADIPSWAAESVSALRKAGALQGDDRGYVLPKNPTTRAEAFVLIARLAGWETSSGSTAFHDDAIIPKWAKPYIKAAEQKGFAMGSGGFFNPSGKLTRAEAVMLLMRLKPAKS